MDFWRTVRIVLVPAIIIAAAFFVPRFELSFDTSNLLSMVTFLFTIVIGFFIASATSNYLGLQSLIVQEDSALIGIFSLGCLIEPKKKKALVEVIDRYLIACLEFDFSSYVPGTRKEFKELIQVVDSIKPDNNEFSSLIQNLHDKKSVCVQSRQGALLAARRVVRPIHWLILVLLTFMIFVLLFILRDSSLLSGLVIGILAVAAYLLLDLLYEIDTNVFLDDIMTYVDVEQVFHVIGRPAYYPKFAFQRSGFRPESGTYRVGSRDTKGKLKIKLVS